MPNKPCRLERKYDKRDRVSGDIQDDYLANYSHDAPERSPDVNASNSAFADEHIFGIDNHRVPESMGEVYRIPIDVRMLCREAASSRLYIWRDWAYRIDFS